MIGQFGLLLALRLIDFSCSDLISETVGWNWVVDRGRTNFDCTF